MADQEFYGYLNDLQARSKARRWWTKALVVCAVLGGVSGAMIGSAIAHVDWGRQRDWSHRRHRGLSPCLSRGEIRFLLRNGQSRPLWPIVHWHDCRDCGGDPWRVFGTHVRDAAWSGNSRGRGWLVIFMQAILSIEDHLRHVTPAIWRRVQTDDCSLDELHDIIQIAMGWQDEHMFAFVIDGKQYGDLERGGDFEHDSRSVRLSDLAEQGHTRFQYDYDFGDGWQHVIEIEKTLPIEEGVYYPRCLKGERACPPEDSGGPYGYPYLLEKLQDPKHEEHEEALEWVGDGFDPEEFDLEKVNEELRYLRRFLGHGKGKQNQTAFIEGDLVHVNPGIVHNQYRDIRLGGWVGNVTRVIWLTPISYEVDWTEPTLQQAHPIYHKRCQRDGISPKSYWLEADQLKEASLESPVAIEQPTNLITRPHSMDQAHDRVRVIFGLTSDDAMPKANEHTQQQFFNYLNAHLTFPSKLRYWPTVGHRS